MRYEFVEFYQLTEDEKKKLKTNSVGTVHIYIVDYELDVRGIRVIPLKKGFFFEMPMYKYREEGGKKGKYPALRFVNDEKQKDLIKFLREEVGPIVEARLKSQSEK